MNSPPSTSRLSLRLITKEDVEAIHALLSIPEVDRYNTLGIPKNLEHTIEIMQPLIEANQNEERNYLTFAIDLKKNRDFIGLIALVLGKRKYNSAETWFKLNPKFWGKGYATEALNALIDFGFDQLKLHRIQAGCAVENTASKKVLEKVGMQLEGRRREILPLSSGWSDNFEFAVLDCDKRN